MTLAQEVKEMRERLFRISRDLEFHGFGSNVELIDAALADLWDGIVRKVPPVKLKENPLEVVAPGLVLDPGGLTEMRRVVDEMITPRPDGTIDLVPIERRPC